MVDVSGETAHDVITSSIDFVLEHGHETEVWGGTIPEDLDDDESPNDFEREMIEYFGGFSYRLENPRARWSDISNHWPGITLREVEDDLFGVNPGMVHEYSKVYDSWLEEMSDGLRYPHTYGQRMRQFGRDPDGSSQTPFIDQWRTVVRHLESDPTSRKACMSLWDPHVDAARMHHDSNAYVPCNVFFQVTVRDGRLHWSTFSRSKDILRGSTENLFEFPLLQELMALELGLDLGSYVEHVSNIHLYQDQIDDGYLDTDWRDPYDTFDPWGPRSLPREHQNEMVAVDDFLLENNIGDALQMVRGISDPYWREWKRTLVAEWCHVSDLSCEISVDAPWVRGMRR